jgi:hypothetical protein
MDFNRHRSYTRRATAKSDLLYPEATTFKSTRSAASGDHLENPMEPTLFCSNVGHFLSRLNEKLSKIELEVLKDLQGLS